MPFNQRQIAEIAAEIAADSTETETAPKLATEPTPTKPKKSKLKLQQEFMKEIIADRKYINN